VNHQRHRSFEGERVPPQTTHAVDSIRRLMLFAALTLSLPTASVAQVVDQKLWVTNGEVDAVVRDGGTLYIGGTFTHVGPPSGGGVALDAATGAPPGTYPKVAGRIYAVISDGAGGWYIGGLFTGVGGLPRSNIAHLSSDMTVSSWNPGADKEVLALARIGSTLYAGGSFTTIAGQPRSKIAALDGTSAHLLPWNPGANGDVRAIAIKGAIVYVGGDFDSLGGQPRNRVGAVLSDGTLTGWKPNASDPVYALATAPNRVYAAGSFLTIGGQTRHYIAALNTSNGAALGWNPNADSEVRTMAVSGNLVYAGGFFTAIGGASRGYIAALDSTTGEATSWDPDANTFVLSVTENAGIVYAGGGFTSIRGVARHNLAAIDGSGNPTSWDPNPNHRVWAIAARGSSIYVGGQFSSIGGQGVQRNYIAALDLSTGEATSWNPSADATVNAIAVLGSTVYAGGYFNNIGGQPRNYIAALDAATGNASAWDPDANNTVWALQPASIIPAFGSPIPVICAGGDFTTIRGQARNRIAALKVADADPNTWDPNANGSVRALAVDGTKIYAGGNFTTIGGASRNYIAALDAGTGAAISWDPNPNGSVWAITPSGPVVYVGGHYSSIGGQARLGIAAIDSATGSATPWYANINDATFAIVVSDSTVVAGGAFFDTDGQSRNNLIALDARTGNTVSWIPNPDNIVHALAMNGSTIYAGGEFLSVAGQPPYCLAGVFLPPDVRRVEPSTGGNGGVVTITIGGFNLQSGASATLMRTGEPDILGTPVLAASDEHSLTATFDLTDAVAGVWDVVVTNPDAQTGTLASGFTITAIEGPQLVVGVIGPPLIRADKRMSYDVVIENPGNVDAVEVPLWIYGVPTDATVELDFPLAAPPQAGGEPDWTTVPLGLTSPGGRYVPVVIPRVPPGTTVRRVLITIPPTHTSYVLRAALTPPWVDGAVFRSCLLTGGVISAPACMGDTLTAVNDYLAANPQIQALSGVGVWAKIAWQCETARPLPAALIKAEQILDFMVTPIEVPGSAIASCSDVLPPRWRDSLLVTIVGSFDPNDKLGVEGTLPLQQAIPYSIRFENASTATAPAQQVVISDPLDVSKLDPITVSLDVITFGQFHIVPPPGLRSYATQVDMRPGRNLLVNVSASVDPFTGVLIWYFTSIDPATGQPPTNPLEGFLPPNNTQNDGEGSVLFTVMPRPTLGSGTQISNTASITFDTNAPHATPTLTNTVDNTPPGSHVLPLAANSDLPSVPVSWTADGGPSDLRDYTVYVSEDSTPYRVWRLNTAATADTLAPPRDHQFHHYSFYSVARDMHGNIEPAPAGPDAATQSRTAVGDVAGTLQLALEGARPNPALGPMRVWFTLPTREPATLDVVDIAGRRVLRHQVGSLGAGTHSLTLDAAATLPPGVYFLKLRQGPNVRSTRVAVIQ
jgi:hypothetical protein